MGVKGLQQQREDERDYNDRQNDDVNVWPDGYVVQICRINVQTKVNHSVSVDTARHSYINYNNERTVLRLQHDMQPPVDGKRYSKRYNSSTNFNFFGRKQLQSLSYQKIIQFGYVVCIYVLISCKITKVEMAHF